MKENYAYLTDLPEIKISMADVNVFLGQDAYHLIRPLEHKSVVGMNQGKSTLPWDVQSVEHYPKQKQTGWQLLVIFRCHLIF